jgi:tol-pal system protein YbgF
MRLPYIDLVSHNGGRTVVIVATALLAAGCASTRPEDDPVQIKLNDIDARVTRIERIISNQSLVDLAQHLDTTQAEVRQLRGRVEELEYKQDSLRKQMDADKRASRGGAASGGSFDSSGSAGVGGAAGAAPGSIGASGAGVGGAGATGGAVAASSAAAGDVAGAGTSEEQTVYSQSFDALKAGSYSVAITGFQDFLKSYPASPLAENAQYWLGEAYYVTHDLDSAAAAFRNVSVRYPNSRKTPDALLKLGYTQIDQKKVAEGRVTLTQVVQKYPGTDAARLAADRLQRTPTVPK